jgi:hypothetical protein
MLVLFQIPYIVDHLGAPCGLKPFQVAKRQISFGHFFNSYSLPSLLGWRLISFVNSLALNTWSKVFMINWWNIELFLYF